MWLLHTCKATDHRQLLSYLFRSIEHGVLLVKICLQAIFTKHIYKGSDVFKFIDKSGDQVVYLLAVLEKSNGLDHLGEIVGIIGYPYTVKYGIVDGSVNLHARNCPAVYSIAECMDNVT